MKSDVQKNVKTTKETVTQKSKFDFLSLLPFAVFIITTLIFFNEQIFGKGFFWEDFAEFVYPLQSFAARESASGATPFWNPYSFVGMPFLADLQTGFFYPLNRLLTLFVGPNGNLPVGALQFITIIHFMIAQTSMYLLLRYFKKSVFASIIAALSYSFSFMFVCHVFHPMIVYHLSWFPLVVMFFYKGMQQSSIKSSIYAGLILGMSMLSGHPQTTLYEVLFLGLLFAWEFISDLIKSDRNTKKIINSIVAGIIPVVIAYGMFQIQFKPAQELADLSARSDMSLEKSAEGSLQYSQVLNSIVPNFFGNVLPDGKSDVTFFLKMNGPDGKETTAPYFYYWDTAYYFGLVALILGLIGFTAIRRNRQLAFYLFISVFGLLFALGDNSFLLGIFHNLPFFNVLRIPARIMFFAVFGFSFAAAYGFDLIKENSKDKKYLLKILLPIAIPLVLSLLGAIGILQIMAGVPSEYADKVAPFATTAFIITLIAGIVIFLYYRGLINNIIAGSILAIITFIDLFSAGADFNVSKIDYSQEYALPSENLDVFRPKYPNDIFRVNMRMYSPSYMAMKRNQGMVSQIMLLEGYNPLLLKRAVPPLKEKDDIHNLFNVKYEIALDTLRAAPYFAERKERLPRAWMVFDAKVLSPESVQSYMKSNKFDYRHSVILEENVDFKSNGIDSSLQSEVKCIEYTNNSMKYEINAPKAGFVVFSEIFYPAWKAKIDGNQTKILAANYCFRAVQVSAGKHTIEMYYDSDTYSSGKLISLITLVLSAATIVVLSIVKKK